MWLLSEVTEIRMPVEDPSGDSTLMWLEVIASLMTGPYFLFLIWMLIHCYRTEPDRFFWTWIMIIVQPIGPVAYFFLRYLPSKEYPAPAFFRRWTRGRELLRLETAAQQIGNPHQFVLWGNALREVGNLNRANEAYVQALKKDPLHLQALWGSAQIATSQKRYDDVRMLTRKILDQDPQYKFGDVSLENARALKESGDLEAGRKQLEWHIQRWRHPEAMYLLAEICLSQGDHKRARDQLLALIQDINGSPLAIARKHGRWKSRARKLLRRIA